MIPIATALNVPAAGNATTSAASVRGFGAVVLRWQSTQAVTVDFEISLDGSTWGRLVRPDTGAAYAIATPAGSGRAIALPITGAVMIRIFVANAGGSAAAFTAEANPGVS